MTAPATRTPSLRLPVPAWMLAAAVAVPLAVAVVATYAAVDPARLVSDTDYYRTALPGLTTDAPLYDPAKLEPHPLAPPPFWDQAPSTALFTLVLLLPAGVAIWGILMAGSVLGGMALVWPRIGPATLVLAPLLLLWFPVQTALLRGNLNALIFGLLAVALRFPRLAGWAIGIGAAAKLVPILGVAWLLGRRDWRGAAIAVAVPLVATLVVLAWKGPDTLIDFITLRANQFKPDPGGRIGLVQTLGVSETVAMALGGLVALLAWWRVSFSLAVVAMLVSVPLMHSHYWSWLLVPALGIWIPWVQARLPAWVVRGRGPAPGSAAT